MNATDVIPSYHKSSKLIIKHAESLRFVNKHNNSPRFACRKHMKLTIKHAEVNYEAHVVESLNIIIRRKNTFNRC